MPDIVNVAIPVNVNSLYSYSIPSGTDIKDVIGRRVLVNFNGRKIRGYAVSQGNDSGGFKIKEIIRLLD